MCGWVKRGGPFCQNDKKVTERRNQIALRSDYACFSLLSGGDGHLVARPARGGMLVVTELAESLSMSAVAFPHLALISTDPMATYTDAEMERRPAVTGDR